MTFNLQALPTTEQVEPITLKAPEAANALGVSQRTLWAWTKAGTIPCIRIGDGPRKVALYPVEALKAWALERAEGGAE